MEVSSLADRLRSQASGERRIWFPGAGLLVLAALLLALGVAMLAINQANLRDGFRAVVHTEEVLRQAANLDIALVDAESASRAYLLTDNADYLDAYHATRTSIDGLMGGLTNLVTDNPDQTARLVALQPLLQRRMARIETAIATDPAQRAQLYAPERVESGQQLRREMRAQLDAFRANEIQLLSQRQERANRAATISSVLAAVTAMLGVALAGLGIYIMQRERGLSRVRELQTELQHLSRVTMMGQTASMLAHEINQPLSAASNYLAASRRVLESAEGAPPAKVVENLEKAAAHVRRAAEIVGRLRRFVGRSESKRTAESVATLVEEAVSLLGTIGDATLIERQVPSNLPGVEVDRVQVQQVMINLIRNAVEAMASCQRRVLTIAAAPSGETLVEIRITDTGPGLPENVASNLFKPFVSTKVEGMGVGLSICRSIVIDHGGRIWAEPNAEGGTVFHFTLPIAGTKPAGRHVSAT